MQGRGPGSSSLGSPHARPAPGPTCCSVALAGQGCSAGNMLSSLKSRCAALLSRSGTGQQNRGQESLSWFRFEKLWGAVVGSPCPCLPFPVAHPCLHLYPPCQMEPALCAVYPDNTTSSAPTPMPRGCMHACLLGDRRLGWEHCQGCLTASLRLPRASQPCLVTAALALADCPVPGLDSKSLEGSSQLCVWPPPCPMAWLWVWQANAGQAWGPQEVCVESRVCVCVRGIWVVQRTLRGVGAGELWG